MVKLSLQIIPTVLLKTFTKEINSSVEVFFEELKDDEINIETFNFYTSVSAVFSSKIEGEEMDLDSFLKHKHLQAKYNPDYTKKIDDLFEAYLFAKDKVLAYDKVIQAHSVLTKNLLHTSQQGVLRTGQMFVMTDDGRIEYVACAADYVKDEVQKLFNDIEILMQSNLTFNEVIFFASIIHLVFVKIHPFNDGNGRTARLLEKWFLKEKLGEKAWLIQSEKYYYINHALYYKNIRMLGVEYEQLDYTKALPFLKMLPMAIAIKTLSE